MVSWLRQGLVQLCCANRAPRPSLGGLRRLVGAFGEPPTAYAYAYASSGPDADEFDRAFRANDLEAFVRLLGSTQAVQRLEEPRHPWATAPRSVGALAATQLALLASVAARGDPEIKAKILRAGAVPPLVELLRPEEDDDRRHAAVLALNALTEDWKEAGAAAYEAGALPPLIACLGADPPGLRGACASTLRHICMESEEYCDAFVGLGGMAGLVGQLDDRLYPPEAGTELVLEAMWNLEDVTLDPRGNVVERFARLALEQGAAEKLEALKKSHDTEVSGAAQKVLETLSQGKFGPGGG